MTALLTEHRGRAGWMLAPLVAALAVGCGTGKPVTPAPESAAALTAVVGPLPAGLEILFHEPRGDAAAAWIVSVPGVWRPHESVDHRHKTFTPDAFLNLVAATSRGTVDPGRPAESSCRYTEWRSNEAAAGPRRDLRIYQLTTDRGEVTVLETLPDPAGG
jgi:hypothetical protein